MKIVVAPDSFKENMTASEVAGFIEAGIRKANPGISVKKIPVADGGEGTVEALVTATGGKIVENQVSGPLMEKVPSFFGILGDGETAVVEMAAAAGLNLVPPDKRNPLDTTTYGVGELILAAIEHGCRKIILGIGGSATNDGGMGMAQALGVKFRDSAGNLLGQGGRYLGEVAAIDISGLDGRITSVEIDVACDIKNTMCGEKGASYVYGPQKGATPEMVEFLDSGMKNFASVIKSTLGKDIKDIPGSGAAGGLGGGSIAFADAVLKPGIDIVMQACRFEEEIKNSDLLITGEGKTDRQTAFGKVPVGLAAVAEKYNVPVICLSGSLGAGYEEIYKYGIDAAFSNVNDAMPLEEAMLKSGELLTQAAYALTRLVMKIRSSVK